MIVQAKTYRRSMNRFYLVPAYHALRPETHSISEAPVRISRGEHCSPLRRFPPSPPLYERVPSFFSEARASALVGPFL